MKPFNLVKSTLRTLPLRWLALVFFFSCLQAAYAGEERFNGRLEGAAIANGASVHAEDDKYLQMLGNPTGWQQDFALGRVMNVVSLRHMPEDSTYYGAAFSASVAITITSVDSGFDTTVVHKTLAVDYDPVAGTSYLDRDACRFYGGHWVNVEITGITPTSGFPGSLALENEIIVERHYTFDPTQTTAIAVESLNGKELEFSWNTVTGAEEYDLEWVLIQDYDGALNTYVPAADLSFDFRRNATRITTPNTWFKTPQVFEHGYILYRVRPVGKHAPAYTTRWEGTWSQSAVSGGVNTYADKYHNTIVPESENLNWGATAVYAEQGRQGFSMVYGDGIARPRQSIGLLNTEGQTMVAETVFDQHGRATIGILPAPADTCSFAYDPAFNQDTLGNPYGLTQFDYDPQTGCALEAAPLSTNSGAGRYYSPNNPDQEDQQAYLPDAEGYPFSQVEFMPDGTGRPRRAGGVGKDHQLGSGHEIEFFYADPTADELTRLFGTEAGEPANYQKNAVVDANGQMSISYVDLAGNVVATALAGDAADGMDALPTNTGTELDTASLLKNDSAFLDPYNLPVFETTTTQLIHDDGSHLFSYGITPSFFTDTCLPANICYDCVYELEISVIDPECGTELLAGGPKVSTIGQLPLDTLCQNTNWNYTDTFSLYLEQGVYQIRKTLRLSRKAMDYYADQFLAQDSCLLTYNDFYQVQLDSLDFTSCSVNYCELGCVQSLGSEAAYIAGGGTAAEYLELLNTCMIECYASSPCLETREVMLTDVSPGGQYGLHLDANNLTDVSLYDLSVLNPSNSLPGAGTHWRNPSTPYLNEQGLPDSIEVSPGVKVLPGDTAVSVELFIQLFKRSWAESLLPYHPEYCYLSWCDSNAQSHAWNARFQRTYYYNHAADSGYMNPLGMTTGEGAPSSLVGTAADADPFFASGGLGNGSIANMKHKLQNFLTIGSTTYTIWEVTRITTYCPGANTTTEANNCLSTAPAWGTDSCLNDLLWSRFQQNYLGAKQLVYDSLMTDYAIKNGCYNACVGDREFASNDNDFDCYPILQSPVCVSNINHYNGYLDTNQLCDTNDYILFRYKIQRFPVGEQLDSLNYANQLSSFAVLDDSLCTNTCQSYADAWMMALSTCGLDTADSAAIRAELIEICKLGCLGGASSGASSTPPDTSSAQGRQTFEEVLTAYGYGNDSCSAWLISGPYPFGHNYSLNSAPLDTCGCNAILSNHDAFFNNPLPAGVTTEIELMQNTYGVIVPNLTSLVCACDGAFSTGGGSWSSNATWPTSAQPQLDSHNIVVPPAITCNTCLYCDTYDDWLDSFALAQPNMVDSTYYEQMLANYLNSQLNYNLSPLEYKNFGIWCDAIVGPAGDTLPLCNRSIFPPIVVDTLDPCVEFLLQTAEYNATEQFNTYQETIRAEFEAEYAEACKQAQSSEYFDLIFDRYEYHFTLYYYDQAGNLVSTVPPAGVDQLSDGEVAVANQYRFNKTGQEEVPEHTLRTEYRYNSFGGLIETKSPDGGKSQFFYDHLGRLVLSQNEEQANPTPYKRYSYTEFDALGRIKEVGELQRLGEPTENDLKNPVDLQNWIDAATKTQITRTFYDAPLNSTTNNYFDGGQKHLRLRVASIAFYETDVADANYDFATHYTYDAHGNVYEVIQDLPALSYLEHQLKRITYDYELISGNVLQVNYQEGEPDAYHHRYTYDADNRLQTVETSQDRVFWVQDAKYHYYTHGPLARIETGEQQVHASDLAYTIHGWLKGVNSNTLDPSRDMGRDGFGNIGSASGALSGVEGHARFARDAAGFSLGYYEGDYKAISDPGSSAHFVASTANSGLSTAASQLYNGNIGHMVTAIQGFNAQATAYRYDQLNRLTEVNAFQNLDVSNNQWNPAGGTSDYETRISYDGNGNILSLKRNGIGSTNLAMDDFTYTYNGGTNRLDHVDDTVADTLYTEDLDDQDTLNYQYNLIGQLIADAHDSIALIEWTPYGKVKRITRETGSTKPDLEFHYDATGNRVAKTMKPREGGTVSGPEDWEITWYALDASGSMMATYKQTYAVDTTAGDTAWGSFQLENLGPRPNDINIFVAGVSITCGAVFVPNGASQSTRVQAVLDAINNCTSSPTNYTATANGAVITITATVSGSAINGDLITATFSATEEYQDTINTVNHIQGGLDPGISYRSDLDLGEHHLYGSARLGIHTQDQWLSTAAFDADIDSTGFTNINVSTIKHDTLINFTDSTDSIGIAYGFKQYEFTNHLGNVLATFSDRKLANDPNTNGIIDYFSTDVLSRTDYYAFGMLMPGRNDNADAYRFGLNGMEKDNEVSGTGNSYTTYFRSYDPRIGRWRSIDPVTHPFQSPYNGFDNNPIFWADPSGADAKGGGGDPPKDDGTDGEGDARDGYVMVCGTECSLDDHYVIPQAHASSPVEIVASSSNNWTSELDPDHQQTQAGAKTRPGGRGSRGPSGESDRIKALNVMILAGGVLMAAPVAAAILVESSAVGAASSTYNTVSGAVSSVYSASAPFVAKGTHDVVSFVGTVLHYGGGTGMRAYGGRFLQYQLRKRVTGVVTDFTLQTSFNASQSQEEGLVNKLWDGASNVNGTSLYFSFMNPSSSWLNISRNAALSSSFELRLNGTAKTILNGKELRTVAVNTVIGAGFGKLSKGLNSKMTSFSSSSTLWQPFNTAQKVWLSNNSTKISEFAMRAQAWTIMGAKGTATSGALGSGTTITGKKADKLLNNVIEEYFNSEE